MTPSALPPSLLTDALQACVVGVVITDATKGDHPVVYANPAFERLTGYSQDEILGRNCRFLQGQDKQQLALDQVRQALHQGESVTVTLRNYRKDGILFHNELTLSPVRNASGQVTHYLGFQNDVTERHQQDTHRAALTGLSRALSATYDPSDVLDVVLNAGLNAMEAAAGGISLLTPDGQFLELVGHAGYPESAVKCWMRFPVTLHAPVTDAVREHRALYMSAADFRTRYPEIHRDPALQFQSAAVLPLVVDHQVIGALSLSFEKNRHFDARERSFLQMIADQCAHALDRSRLHHNLRRLADNTTDLVRQYSRDGHVEYCSPSAWDMLGFHPEELLNSDPLHAVHPEDQPALRDAYLRRFTPTFEQEKFEYRLRHQNGSAVWVETSFKALRDPATKEINGFIGTTRDISQRRHAEQRLLGQLERYQHLLNFTVSLEQLHSPDELMAEALNQCLTLTEYEYGIAFEYTGGVVRRLTEAGDPPSSGVNEKGIFTGRIAAPVPRALRRGQAYFLEEDHVLLDPPEVLSRSHWVSVCLLPVMRQRTLVGVLAFGTDHSLTTSPGTRQLLSSVGARLSHALERQHHLAELNTSREETLRALGLALEYRDYETKGHTDRVVQLTQRLGQAMGFLGDDLDALRWGAFLHDTGKVAIPDAILLKPGKLDAEEWAVIKRHPGIGYEMLQHIPSLPPSTLEVVLYHQERWDGSGYPKGLAGMDIPLAARVFAVVDVYDALTSERPYKKAWTREAAVAQLQKEAGVLLDARVVEAFVRVLAQHDERVLASCRDAG
ncbi:hypothetical protein GCM10008955_42200 [Deinococcus malanensis]|uniref:PAS domain S-box protein n=1 Tax=Deinococcus malanensis TaxID=1706855 RepID=A0ABQ2F5D9_9DEIO|nr:PAS domain S-box protein [Deinococcus malanensis]GGK44007.1 hypothetical protein GCM10008955_42200 [Deinococcus malanensis]